MPPFFERTTPFANISAERDQETGTLTFQLVGEFDLPAISLLKETIKAAGYDEVPPAIIFDLSRLSYIDTTGLQTLAGYQEAWQAQAPSVSIVLCNPSQTVLRLIELLGFEEDLKIEFDEAKLGQRKGEL